jgi:hypothetical protein
LGLPLVGSGFLSHQSIAHSRNKQLYALALRCTRPSHLIIVLYSIVSCPIVVHLDIFSFCFPSLLSIVLLSSSSSFFSFIFCLYSSSISSPDLFDHHPRFEAQTSNKLDSKTFLNDISLVSLCPLTDLIALNSILYYQGKRETVLTQRPLFGCSSACRVSLGPLRPIPDAGPFCSHHPPCAQFLSLH